MKKEKKKKKKADRKRSYQTRNFLVTVILYLLIVQCTVECCQHLFVCHCLINSAYCYQALSYVFVFCNASQQPSQYAIEKTEGSCRSAYILDDTLKVDFSATFSKFSGFLFYFSAHLDPSEKGSNLGKNLV